MIIRSLCRRSIATFAAFSILSAYSLVGLAAPAGKVFGSLSVSGQVTVNGEKVVSGGTIFNDCSISTAADGTVTVNIHKIGSVTLEPSTDLRLGLAENDITATLINGSAQVSTSSGATVHLTTDQGTIFVDGAQPTAFTVNAGTDITHVATHLGIAQLTGDAVVKQIAAGESATIGDAAPAGQPVPAQTPQSGSGQPAPPPGGMSGGSLAVVLLLVVGGPITAAILAGTRNGNNVGGSGVVVSPIR